MKKFYKYFLLILIASWKALAMEPPPQKIPSEELFLSQEAITEVEQKLFKLYQKNGRLQFSKLYAKYRKGSSRKIGPWKEKLNQLALLIASAVFCPHSLFNLLRS